MNAQDKDMRSYDDPQLVKSNLRSPDAEDNRINFIQPKYKVPEATVVKQGTKSKLSMMLSCLSGDFEDEKPQSSILASNDVVDAKKSLDSEVSTITSSNPSTAAAVLTFGTVTTSTVQSAIATPSISTNAMKSAVPVVKESTETTSSSKVTDSEVKGDYFFN